MAFVVATAGGRWEIRESVWTPGGPRARTLASFTSLTDSVLDRAEGRATSEFDRAKIVASARRRGAPAEVNPADRHAAALIRAAARGHRMRPGLRRVLTEQLGAGDADHAADDSLAPWIAAPAVERGRALVDLLGLADRLPKPPPAPLLFPGLHPRRRPA
ncbi:MAG TPA: hypothetical protein VGB64_01230 [Actinomycetota bacterium]